MGNSISQVEQRVNGRVNREPSFYCEPSTLPLKQVASQLGSTPASPGKRFCIAQLTRRLLRLLKGDTVIAAGLGYDSSEPLKITSWECCLKDR